MSTHDPIVQMRTRVVEAALAWQQARADVRRGTAHQAVEIGASLQLETAVKVYRAATR